MAAPFFSTRSARSMRRTQIKLLRVMSEDRAFERVGGSQTLHADVRVIAATNKNLETLVSEGKFRDDLYFRLNVVKITMPPLRERKEDIPLLVRAFLRHFCKANDKPLLDLTTDAMNTLLTYDWPGNVRELRTAIEHGVVMATGAKVTLRDLPGSRPAGRARGRRRASDPSTKTPARSICTRRRSGSSCRRSRRPRGISPPPRRSWASAAAPCIARSTK